MKNYTAKALQGETLFMGIDIHKKSWTITVRTFEKAQGTLKIKGISDLLEILSVAPVQVWKIVYEAGYSGFWLQRELKRKGYNCIVTSPALVPVRVGCKVKTDKIDSQRLAECLAAGQLRAVYIPTEQEEARRELVRQREQFVKDLVRAKNRIKSFLALHNADLNINGNVSWSISFFERLKKMDLGWPELNRTLERYITALEFIGQSVRELTTEIAELSKNDDLKQNAALLRSIPGIGPLTSMAILLELGDLKRFRNSRQLAAYVGLTPSQYSSGEKVYMGRITRSGKALVRRMLIEAVWTAKAHCSEFQEKYEKIAKFRGSKRAAVALARKMLVMCRSMLISQTVFEPSKLRSN
jgi:transposase